MKKQVVVRRQDEAEEGELVSVAKYAANARRNRSRDRAEKQPPSNTQEGRLVSMQYSNNPAGRRQKAKSAPHAADHRQAIGKGSNALNPTFVSVDRPDDVFDMFERYTTEERNLRIMKCRSIDERFLTKSPENGEEGDENDEANQAGSEYNFMNLIDSLRLPETFGQRQQEQEEQPKQEEQNKPNDYILGLIDKLRLREVVEQIQAYPTATKSESSSEEKEPNSQSQISNDLRNRLEQEESKSKDLQQKLKHSERRQQKERIEFQKQIASLEVKLLLQESAHSDSLAEQHHEFREMDALLQSKPELRASIFGRQEGMQNLEREVADLRDKNTSLEETLEARQCSYDSYVTSANNRIKELEASLSKSRGVQGDEDRVKRLEAALAETEGLLDLARKQIRTLKLAATRNAIVLETEKKRTEALEQLNQKMKLAMKKLTKKASLLTSAQQQIVALTKELEKRGKVMTSIKRILTVNGQTIPGLIDVGVSRTASSSSTIQVAMNNKEYSSPADSATSPSQDLDMISTNPVVEPQRESRNPTKSQRAQTPMVREP